MTHGFVAMANDNEFDASFGTANTHGNTLKATSDHYARYCLGDRSWSTDYPDHYVSGSQFWHSSWAFWPIAFYFHSYDAWNTVNQTHGTDPDGDTYKTPHTSYNLWNKAATANLLTDQPGSTGSPPSDAADTTTPNNVTSLTAPRAGSTWVELAWTDASVTSCFDIPKTYKIYANSGSGFVLNGTSRNRGYTASGLTKGTSYTFKVATVDFGGNESAGTTVVKVTDSP